MVVQMLLSNRHLRIRRAVGAGMPACFTKAVLLKMGRLKIQSRAGIAYREWVKLMTCSFMASYSLRIPCALVKLSSACCWMASRKK